MKDNEKLDKLIHEMQEEGLSVVTIIADDKDLTVSGYCNQDVLITALAHIIPRLSVEELRRHGKSSAIDSLNDFKTRINLAFDASKGLIEMESSGDNQDSQHTVH